MSQAVRDGNYVPVALGASSASSTTTLPFQVDSVTGRLLMDITNVADVTQTIPQEPADRDQNYVPAGMGVSSADGVTPMPLMIDSNTGLLFCDVLIEP